MIRRWSQGVRTVKATRGFLLFISFRHRTALDGSGCFYGSRLTHKLEAAWSNQTYEDGDAPRAAVIAVRGRHWCPVRRRVAQRPRRHLLWPAAVIEKKPKPCEATAVNAAATTVVAGFIASFLGCRRRAARRRWLLHASVLLCLKQESSQLLLLLLWLLHTMYVLLWYFYAAFYP